MASPNPGPLGSVLGNYAYAGIVTGRSPFYLPDTVKPTGGVGYARNLTMQQTPMTEVTFLTGDGKRKITPLLLSGTYFGTSEEETRLWGAELEESLALWTGVQRSVTVVRALLLGGTVAWDTPDRTAFIRPFTISLFPAGPSWLDANGNPVPF